MTRVRALVDDAEFIASVEKLYAALDDRISARRPCCTNRGLCCKFTTFGHKLFVTPVEREGRPSGCRIFFCEESSQSWLSPETEATLEKIKVLHARFDVPYVYVEWLDALRAVSDSQLDEQSILVDTDREHG